MCSSNLKRLKCCFVTYTSLAHPSLTVSYCGMLVRPSASTAELVWQFFTFFGVAQLLSTCAANSFKQVLKVRSFYIQFCLLVTNLSLQSALCFSSWSKQGFPLLNCPTFHNYIPLQITTACPAAAHIWAKIYVRCHCAKKQSNNNNNQSEISSTL